MRRSHCPSPRLLGAVAAAVAIAFGLAGTPERAAAQAAPPSGVSIAALAQQARVRTALDGLMPPERDVSLIGVELGAPTFWRPLRVQARMLRSSREDDLASMEAGLLLLGRFVSFEAAYATRESYSPANGLAHGRSAGFVRGGLRTRFALGATGLSLFLRGNGYAPAGDDVQGWDAESGLTFTPRALPLSASLGYRLERFRIFDVEQEVSALTLGLGFTFLGR